MSITQLFPLIPGAPPVAVTDAGNSPAGFALINRGDHGGTITVQAGSSGPPVMLTPGGSLTWTDRYALPYAAVIGSTAETLIITDQMTDYANPAAVAAATAVQLATQGIPSTFLGNQLWAAGSFTESAGIALARGEASPVFDVSQYNSIIAQVTWSSQTDVGAAVGRFDFGFGKFYGAGNSLWAGIDNVTFTMPVIGPTLQITNKYAPMSAIRLYGTNRPAPSGRLTHIPDNGVRRLNKSWSGTPVAGTTYDLISADGQSSIVRMAGSIKLIFHNFSGAGIGPVFVSTVSPFANIVEYPLSTTSAYGQVFDLGAPCDAPLFVRYRCDTSPAPTNLAIEANVVPSGG